MSRCASSRRYREQDRGQNAIDIVCGVVAMTSDELLDVADHCFKISGPEAVIAARIFDVEQMLTEARVIIPRWAGAAWLSVHRDIGKILPGSALSIQIAHAFGLCAVALVVLLLMTPATSIALLIGGEDDPGFFNIGSSFVIAAVLPLAIGTSADVAVVFFVVTGSVTWAVTSGSIATLLMLGLWYVYPVSCRGHPLFTSFSGIHRRGRA